MGLWDENNSHSSINNELIYAACSLSLEVLSQEAGVDLLESLSTVAAQQTADFSTKVWAHLLCDSDDLSMPDLC